MATSHSTSFVGIALVLTITAGCSSSSTTIVSAEAGGKAGSAGASAVGGNASGGNSSTGANAAGGYSSGGTTSGGTTSGGTAGVGGNTNPATTGGASSTEGGAAAVGGTQATGGSVSMGGVSGGGVTSTSLGGASAGMGGVETGGKNSTGGVATGGVSTLATGGVATGGVSTLATGGTSTGGSAAGGSGSGGSSGTSGSGTGGVAPNPCAAANPCVRGTCDDSSGTARCLCPQGWGGPDCSKVLCTLCVDDGAASGGSGECWLRPLNDLQTALSVADGVIPSCTQGGVQIWVAEGTYRPSTTGDRAASFALRDNVSIYGGFAGTEVALSERNPSTHITVLSGDLSGNDGTAFSNNGENARHVVTSIGNGPSAILNGVTVKGGNANENTGYGAKGGGMFIRGGSPNIVGVTFLQNFAGGNFAYAGGGALFIEDAQPSVSSSTFRENLAACGPGYNGGGAIYSDGASHTQLRDVVFLGNQTTAGSGAYQGGGAIYAFGISVPLASQPASLSIVNARFLGNSAGTQDHQYSGGGAILGLDTQFTIVNSAFAGNSTTGAARGGAAYILFDRGIPQLTNVTMVGNSTAADGRALYVFQVGDNVTTLTNSVVWGNTGSGTEIAGDIVTATYTCAPGVSSGSGNLPSCNPILVAPSGADGVMGTLDDDLRLGTGSPALNCGNNNAPGLTGITTDLANNPRLNGVVDLGAYERP